MLDWFSNPIAIAFAIYAIVATLFIVFRARAESVAPELAELRKMISEEKLTPEQKAACLSTMSKIRTDSAPWFERTLSTIGVAAFISMLAATVVQTRDAATTQAKLLQAQTDLAAVQARRASLESQLPGVSRAIVDDVLRTSRLASNATEILSYRLESLLSSDNPTEDDISDAFKIALILERWEAAAKLLREHPDLEASNRAVDLAPVAAYYFIMGQTERAKPLVERLLQAETQLGALRVDVYVLASFLAIQERETLINRIAASEGITADKALERFNTVMDRLIEGRSQYLRKMGIVAPKT